MEATLKMNQVTQKQKKHWFSLPLLQQSIRANFGLWLALTLGSAAIFIIINLVVGTKQIFTSIDMGKVSQYVKDENMQWLQILGLLDNMGFSLDRIAIMSQIDVNSVMNELVYKIAGVLLPMIYVMIVANRLLASQVNDGSMAYVLSTPTNRKTVVRTQYIFMITSLFLMYLVITLGAVFSGIIAFHINTPSPKSATLVTVVAKTVLYCLGSFVAMFGLTGICFGASAWFNKSGQSIAVGGGACILCFLCCILGLFGNRVFVGVGVGVEAMNAFNFLTLYTLIDTESMTLFAKAISGIADGMLQFTWLWKLAILVAVGIAGALVGSIKFVKKDLPL